MPIASFTAASTANYNPAVLKDESQATIDASKYPTATVTMRASAAGYFVIYSGNNAANIPANQDFFHGLNHTTVLQNVNPAHIWFKPQNANTTVHLMW